MLGSRVPHWRSLVSTPRGAGNGAHSPQLLPGPCLRCLAATGTSLPTFIDPALPAGDRRAWAPPGACPAPSFTVSFRAGPPAAPSSLLCLSPPASFLLSPFPELSLWEVFQEFAFLVLYRAGCAWETWSLKPGSLAWLPAPWRSTAACEWGWADGAWWSWGSV